MSRFFEEADQAEAFIAAFTKRLGAQRVFWEEQVGFTCPLRGSQTLVDRSNQPDQPSDDSVLVRQNHYAFTFQNHWGFDLAVSLPNHAAVRIYLSVGIPLPEREVDRDTLHGLAAGHEVSFRPEPHERGPLKRVRDHNRALTAALRERGFSRVGKHYAKPGIERTVDRLGEVLEACVWSDSEWLLHKATLDQLVETVGALMDCRWSTVLDL